MKKLLGTIVDTVTMGEVERLIILDRDCSSELKIGGSILIEFQNGTSTTLQVQDGMIQKGADYNIPSENISTMRVKNQGFPEEYPAGSKVYLV